MATLRDDALPVLQTIPPILASLDVTILHQIILKTILKISDEQQEQKMFLEYEKDIDRAIDSVRSGRVQSLILMRPPLIDQVREVAEAGHVMPQKSTYFYPKLLSGLVNYSFELF